MVSKGRPLVVSSRVGVGSVRMVLSSAVWAVLWEYWVLGIQRALEVLVSWMVRWRVGDAGATGMDGWEGFDSQINVRLTSGYYQTKSGVRSGV